MSQEIIEQARILGDMLAKSEEILQFREAETKLADDPVAQDLIEDYQALHAKQSEAKRSGGDLSAEEKAQFEQVEKQVHSNATINSYMEAQSRYTALLDSINYLVMKAINGGEDSCSTDCGGCSGCGC